MKLNKVINGDCLEVLKSLEENSIDSIVTDPPYELGFMGKSWDNTGIAYNAELWKQCLRVLKPGAHLLAFSGTRTYHRMAVAIEDAGFEVRDMIEWVYGSGFPKSLNIGKEVDKLQGNEREVVGKYQRPDGTDRDYEGWESNNKTSTVQNKAPTTTECRILTKGTSAWEGWGTAIKPAHEPICMARKPLSEKNVALNVLKWGTGGINIDESRVETEDNITIHGSNVKSNTFSQVKACEPYQTEGQKLGRFPANLIHDNSEEVRECFPKTKSQGHWSKTKTKGFGKFGNGISSYEGVGEKDKVGGNTSRFFKSILYYPKASKSERNKGCEELEFETKVFRKGEGLGGQQITAIRQNNHPTVKPIALMEYLIKMVTFEGGVVLDPFAGSGTTLIAAKKNGYQYIGIEKESEYIEIINARLDDAQLNIFEL